MLTLQEGKAEDELDQYKGAVAGLVICLVIVIVYAIVATVYLYRYVFVIT